MEKETKFTLKKDVHATRRSWLKLSNRRINLKLGAYVLATRTKDLKSLEDRLFQFQKKSLWINVQLQINFASLKQTSTNRSWKISSAKSFKQGTVIRL